MRIRMNTLIRIFCFVFLFFICGNYIFADDPYWGDDYFEKRSDSLLQDKATKIQQPIFEYGLFPKPIIDMWFSIVGESVGWDYSSGGIMTPDFHSPYSYFNAKSPTDNIEDIMEEKKSWSDEDVLSWYESNPNIDNIHWGLSCNYPVPSLHTIFSAYVGYSQRHLLLYTPIRTNLFAGYDNEVRTFEEISVLNIKDETINAELNFKHPIYGAFVNMTGSYFSTNIFYYLNYGIGCDFTIADSLTSANYIATERDVLRYTDGTIKSINYENIKYNARSIRPYYTIGLGWQFQNINFELQYKASINPNFDGNDYKHSILYFRTGIDLNIFIPIAKTLLSIFGLKI